MWLQAAAGITNRASRRRAEHAGAPRHRHDPAGAAAGPSCSPGATVSDPHAVLALHPTPTLHGSQPSSPGAPSRSSQAAHGTQERSKSPSGGSGRHLAGGRQPPAVWKGQAQQDALPRSSALLLGSAPHATGFGGCTSRAWAVEREPRVVGGRETGREEQPRELGSFG